MLPEIGMAERQGFEPWIQFPVYTLSKRAPSATRPSLRWEAREQRRFFILTHRYGCVCADRVEHALRRAVQILPEDAGFSREVNARSHLSHLINRSCFVSGHDFSRADERKQSRASAPALRQARKSVSPTEVGSRTNGKDFVTSEDVP